MYINCHTYHSLRYGTIPDSELVALAKECGVQVLALTDINTITGVYNFIKDCREHEIKPVIGIEFRNKHKLLYIGLAKNNAGFAELNSFLSDFNRSKKMLPERAPEMTNAYIIYSLERAPENLEQNEYLGIRPEELVKLIQPKWKSLLHKMVMWQPATLRNKKEFNLNKILCATKLNIILSKLQPEDHARETDKMLPLNELLDRFKDYPLIIDNTRQLLYTCEFNFDFSIPRNKLHYTGTKDEDEKLLKRLAYQGMTKRYGNNNDLARHKITSELEVINDMNFAGYYLINWDITQKSQKLGLPYVGRGSGANSIVSYCLEITAICPIELNLYFERFLNRGRTSPPDFDIDWSWQDRDTILDYIFERYGKDYVAFCGTIARFGRKSIVRELGKVFGLSEAEIKPLAAQFELNENMDLTRFNHIVQAVFKYGKLLVDFPYNRSMHSCGIIISEEPLVNVTALEMYPKGYAVVQFDMDIAEDIGYEKFDILSQRGLGTISDCVKLIKTNCGLDVNIEDRSLSLNESLTNERLKRGKTIGAFYIESPAIRGLLRKLQCDNYITLVAASSIVRPAVAQGGAMGEYVVRHRKKVKFDYLHPVFEEHLAETYGIMIYQEDVIKIAHHFAGMSLKDADILRKGRAHTKEYQRVCTLFFELCAQKRYSEALTNEVFRQIQSFAGFSFCKAHSASYAVESYQSLYLKVHYPIEFIVAAINNFGGFYRTEVYVHEARMGGAIVHNPCINKSNELTTLYGKDLYLGFVHVKSLGIGEQIVAERTLNGDYTSIENFIRRVGAGEETISLLIYAGAFKCFGFPKHELILMYRMFLKRNKNLFKTMTIFDEPPKSYKLPHIDRSPFEDCFDEMEIFTFPISYSPFELLQEKERISLLATDLCLKHGEVVEIMGYLISIKSNPTKNGMMMFGTWIDLKGDYFDTAHFANTLARYPLNIAGCYRIFAKVDVDLDFPTLIVVRMERLPYIPDPRFEDDKDRQYRAHENMKADLSLTHRAPHPTPVETALPRNRMD